MKSIWTHSAGGSDYAHQITNCPPELYDLPTSLSIVLTIILFMDDYTAKMCVNFVDLKMDGTENPLFSSFCIKATTNYRLFDTVLGIKVFIKDLESIGTILIIYQFVEFNKRIGITKRNWRSSLKSRSSGKFTKSKFENESRNSQDFYTTKFGYPCKLYHICQFISKYSTHKSANWINT